MTAPLRAPITPENLYDSPLLNSLFFISENAILPTEVNPPTAAPAIIPFKINNSLIPGVNTIVAVATTTNAVTAKPPANLDTKPSQKFSVLSGLSNGS